MEDNNILGVVLAGGKSKRFGEDKNQAKLGAKTLLEHTIIKVSAKFNNILVVSNYDLKINTPDTMKVIPDCIEGNLGPLVGVLSAMKWIKKNNKLYQWIATFPSDTPFFDESIIDQYKKRINLNDSLLYFIKSNEKRHNILGLWSLKLIDTLENDLINNNFRKVEDWANKIGSEIIDINSNNDYNFLNINTKEDLEKAKKNIK